MQALSPTLLRVEPKGPDGFEDRTTFMVVDRSFGGLDIVKKQETAASTLLSTAAYEVLVRHNISGSPSCGAVTTAADVVGAIYSQRYPNGTTAAGRETCCHLCDTDEACVGWLWKGDDIYDIDPVPTNDTNCWLLAGFSKRVSMNDCGNDKAPLEFGCSRRSCGSMPSFQVTTLDGALLYDTETDRNSVKNLLHWPAPLSALSYAITDSPRFFMPEYGAVPWEVVGASVTPDLRSTNGYDFRNNVHGDTYIFLLGKDVDGWT